MNTNQKIQSFLEKHKSQKKLRFFTVVLSLLMVLAVVSSLIMPAISMTIEYLQDSNVMSEDIMLLSAVPDNIKNSATDIKSADNYKIEVLDDSEKSLFEGNEYVTNNDSLNINFNVEYTFNDAKNKFNSSGNNNNLEDNVNLYLDVNLPKDLVDVIKNNLSDNNVWDGDTLAGYFFVHENYIAIKFRDDYISQINADSSNGSVHGGFSLEGLLNRDNTAEGDRTFDFGGQSVTVNFPDKSASLEKTNWLNYDGTITWKVTVNNTGGLDLNGYTLTDKMLNGAKDVTIRPNVGTPNGDTITFNSTTDKSITIEYKTDITEEQLKDTNNTNGTRTNTASLKKPDGNKATDDKSSTVTMPDPITVEKTGKADYDNNQGYDGKINWEIRINSKYGTSLNGYKVTDSMISQAVENSLQITPEGVNLVDDKLNVPEGVTASQVTIKYQTTVNKDGADADRTKTNNVIVEYPSGGKAGEDDDTVTYKKESDMISFTKDGTYDKDTHEITWTITVKPQGGYSLNGYTLTDKQFPADINDFTFSPEWVNNGKLSEQIVLNKGQLRFKDDCNIRQNVTITYKIPVSVSKDLPATGTNPIENPISDNKQHSTTATVFVDAKRETMSKSVEGGAKGTTIANSKEIKQEIKWNVDITYDDTFAGKTYTDTLSVKDNISGLKHEFKENSVVVKAKKKEYDGYITIPTSRYTVEKTETGFTIKFNEDCDPDYNYVNITYVTEATIPESAAYDTEYIFNNKGSGFGKDTDEIGYGITKTNPEKKETLDLGINKTWDDNNNSANERPSEVYIKVLYNTKTGNQLGGNYDNAEWTQYGDIIKLTGGSNDYSWSSSLSNLPKSEVKADPTTGQPMPTVYYFYKLIEVDSAGNPITYIDTTNGMYQPDDNYKNSEVGSNSSSTTLSVTNTYKYTDTEISVSKNWTGNGESESNRQPITVRLEYQDNNNGQWLAVEGVSEQELNSGNNWTYKFTEKLPIRIINADGSVTERKYRIVETKFGDTDISDNNKIIIVDGGYYDCGIYSSETNSSNTSNTLLVTNTFHKTESLTISGKKVWDDTDHTDNRPSQVIFKLQRSANYGAWEQFGDEKTVDVTGNEQTFSWSDGLVSQEIVDGKVVTYRYRVLEVGYVYNGTTYRLHESEWNSPKFATKEEEGYYEGTYRTTYSNGNELIASGEITITNKFNTLEMEITPQKKWVGNKLDSIKFRLQRRVNGGEWEDVPGDSDGKTEVTLQSNPDTDVVETEWKDGQQVPNGNVTWKGETIKNLPQKEVEMTLQEDGSYKYEEKPYYYRFVEIVTNDNGTERIMDTTGGYFKHDGKYTVTLGYDLGQTGTFEIVNTFTEDIGVDKTVVNEDLNNKSELMTVEKEDLISVGSPFKKTINGEEYYIFNWVIAFDKAGMSSSTYDQLPEGFSLITPTDTNKKVDWGAGGQNIIDYTTLFDPKTPNYCEDGYFYRPFMIYSNIYLYATNPSANKGINAPTSQNGKDSVIGSASDGYYYDTKENKVYFSKPSVNTGIIFQICYSTKIKCSDLEALIEEGSFEIKNHVVKLEDDGTETDQTAEASVFIKNTAPTNLISKDYYNPNDLDENGNQKYKIAPGYMKFSLDINPEGKNLSTGDTVDVEDIFKTTSYTIDTKNFETGNKKVGPTVTGDNLVDVLMNEIKIYEVDANGVETLLPRSEYTLKFQSKETGVSDSTGENGAALIKLTLPDEKHIKIDYTYKLIANSNTPSVIDECKTKIKGRYVKVEKGSDIPSGDSIKFKNEARLFTESVSGDDSTKETEYKVASSNAFVSINKLPKIKKVDIGNYNINDLDAKFLLARYSETNQSWQYATKIVEKTNGNNEITEWGNDFKGLNIDESAIEINVNTSYEYSISLEKSALYKLIEIKVPEGYEGSNLNLNDEQFKALIINYLNGGTTEMGGVDYKTFLNKYLPIHYFIYNGVVNNYPSDAGFDPDKVIQVNNGADIEIPDNKLIDIAASKAWNDGDKADSEITLELYWSDKKSTIGMPENAKLVTAEDLGIMDPEFSAVQTKEVSVLNANPPQPLWTDLPNGKDDSPIYYYIKETAYQIDGVTYTLVEDEENPNNGKYVSEDGIIGRYYPTYVGNAANSDTTIKVNNSTDLKLIKLWKDSSNNPLKESKITATNITVDIYGTKNDITAAEELIFDDVVITPDATTGKWELNITDLLMKDGSSIDLNQYKSFRAEETSTDPNFKVDDYVVSCVFNLNNSTGEITITNKKIGATSASVTVNKAWSDGDTVHQNDSIAVSLYRSKNNIDVEGKTQSQLVNVFNGFERMSTVMEDGDKYEVTLNTENEWTHTWTGLPLYEDEEDEIGQYYYYVLENGDLSSITDADKYTASYIKDKSSSATKTVFDINNTRNSILAQKEWYDENGDLIQDVVDQDGNVVVDNTSQLPEIVLKLYKKTDPKIRDGCHPSKEGYTEIANVYYNAINNIYGSRKTESLKIVAFGDSITDGYQTMSKTADCYPSQLTEMLKKAGYTLDGDAVVNKGISGEQVGNNSTDGFRRRITSDIPSDADIVLLLGGTNDIHQSGDAQKNPTECMRRLQACIEEIRDHAKGATIIVGSIPHFDFIDANGNTTDAAGWWANITTDYYTDKAKAENEANGYIDSYNTLIKNYVNSSTDNNLYFVDVCKVIEYEQVENSDTILNKANNWTASIDVPDDKNEYCVEEAHVPDGWAVSYENNEQKAGSNTPITVKNQKQVTPKTSIALEKTWTGDRTGDATRNDINLTLMQGTRRQINISEDEYLLIKDNIQNDEATGGYSYVTEEVEEGHVNYYNWTWTPYTGDYDVAEPTDKDISDKWTYVFGVDAQGNPTLPTKDINGNTCYYKVDEDDLPGYSATYGTENDDERNGLVSVDNESAGTLHITNTRLISLKICKIWSDGENHEDEHVTVSLYRSTNPDDVPDEIKNNLMLQVPSNVSLGTNSETTVTANKAITSAESDNENVTVSIDPNDATKIIISSNGNEVNDVKIKVSDGSEEAIINVTVSSLEMFLNGGTDFTIEVGQTGTLSATKPGATFRVVSGSDVVSISGTTLTANKDGTAEISATANGVTVKQTITVTLPSTFTIDGGSEVEIGSDIQLTPNPRYGTFTWSSASKDGAGVAAVDSTGKVTGVAEGEVTITATRNDKVFATKTIKVVNANRVTLGGNESVVFYLNKEHTDVSINKITIDAKNISGMNQMRVRFGSVQDEWAGGFYLKNYGKLEAGGEDKCKVSLEGNKFIITDFTVSAINRITFENGLSGEIELAIEYADNARSETPRRLSAQSASEDSMLLAEGETVLNPVATKDIKYIDGWTWTVEDLDVYDTQSQPYYYWAVEEGVSGYKAVYSFTDNDDETSNCLNASSIGDGLVTIKNIKTVSEGVTLPMTGGTGTIPYYVLGSCLITLSGAILFTRKKIRKAK